MATALDLHAIAVFLMGCGFAGVSHGRVFIDQRLANIGSAATDDVLKRIACLVLERHLPAWFHGAMHSGRFSPEYVPSAALSALDWLGDDFEPILSSARSSLSDDDAYRNWLGNIGEMVVVALEQHSGAVVRHVSKISDGFGYDVESKQNCFRRIEVKTSILGREHKVFLSRNESEKAALYRDEWMLVQVILVAEALSVPVVTAEHVHVLRQVPGRVIVEACPEDTPQSRWIETVELKTQTLEWLPYSPGLSLPVGWSLPGLSLSPSAATPFE